MQTRAEALALRNELLQKQFAPGKGETSPGTVIADTVRRLECDLARFSKLLSALPSAVGRSGVEVSEADRLVLLLRSLPTPCAEFALLHSAQENYSMARQTAIRYETQRRLYLDWNSFGQKPGNLLHGVGKPEVDMTANDGSQPESGDAYVEAIADRCNKCGSKRHETASCTVDLSRTKCFKCGGTGHVSMNCTKNGGGNSASSTQKGNASSGGKGSGNSKGSTGAKGKGGKPSKGKGKDKGKAKGKGGKGKMFEVSQEGTTTDDWWFQDESGYCWAATTEWSDVAAVGKEPEQEGSPVTGAEQESGQPVAATLIAGLFSCITVGIFVSNNPCTSNQIETMNMKPMSFSSLHGSERLAAVNLSDHDMFPVCFKARGDRSFFTEKFQPWSELVVTCDEAWVETRTHSDWRSLDLGLWNATRVSEICSQELFAEGFHGEGCRHVETFHETRVEMACETVGETVIAMKRETEDGRPGETSVETKCKLKRGTKLSRQVTGERSDLEFNTCSVSDGASSFSDGMSDPGMRLDLSFSEMTLEEQIIHEFPGLACRCSDNLDGPGMVWDWTTLHVWSQLGINLVCWKSFADVFHVVSVPFSFLWSCGVMQRCHNTLSGPQRDASSDSVSSSTVRDRFFGFWTQGQRPR